MNEDDILKYKKALLKEHWVEDRHQELKKLADENAKRIVESMNESEVYQYVNIRNMQEDYIADYLAYLWEISEKAFWKHVIVSLDIDKGILWGDHMPHFQKMCTRKIPDDVLSAVLNFAFECNESFIQDFEAIGCVVRAQVEKFGRLEEIKNYIARLDTNKQVTAFNRLKEMINSPCKYRFD